MIFFVNIFICYTYFMAWITTKPNNKTTSPKRFSHSCVFVYWKKVSSHGSYIELVPSAYNTHVSSFTGRKCLDPLHIQN